MRRKKRPLQPDEWGPGEQKRVLVEHSDPLMEWALTRTLTDAGYQVEHCYGPGRDEECPMATTGHCRLAEGADVILHDLRQPDGVGAIVRSAIFEHLPNTPVVFGVQPILSSRRALRTVNDAIPTGGVR